MLNLSQFSLVTDFFWGNERKYFIHIPTLTVLTYILCIIVLMEVKLAPWVGLFFAITDYRRPPTSIFIPPAENVSNKAWFLGLGLFKIYPVVFHFTLQNNNYCFLYRKTSCFSNQNSCYNVNCIFVSFLN